MVPGRVNAGQLAPPLCQQYWTVWVGGNDQPQPSAVDKGTTWLLGWVSVWCKVGWTPPPGSSMGCSWFGLQNDRLFLENCYQVASWSEVGLYQEVKTFCDPKPLVKLKPLVSWCQSYSKETTSCTMMKTGSRGMNMGSVYKLVSAVFSLFDLLGWVELGVMAKATLWGEWVYFSPFHPYVFFSAVLDMESHPIHPHVTVPGPCTVLNCWPSVFTLGSQRNSDA